MIVRFHQPTPAASSQPAAPTRTPLSVVDEIGPPMPEPEGWLRPLVRHPVAVGGGAPLLAGAGSAAAAVGLGAAPVVAGLVGAVAGIGCAVLASELGKTFRAAENRVRQQREFLESACAEFAGATRHDYPGAHAFVDGDRLLVRFPDGKLLKAEGVGDKEDVMFVSEGEARVGTPGADMLVAVNGPIPVSSYTVYSPDGKVLDQTASKTQQIRFDAAGKLRLSRVTAHGKFETVYDLSRCYVGTRDFAVSNGRLLRCQGELAEHARRLPIPPDTFGAIRPAESGAPLPDRAAVAAQARESLATLEADFPEESAAALLSSLRQRTQDPEILKLIDVGQRWDGKALLETLGTIAPDTTMVQMMAGVGTRADGRVLREIARIEPRAAPLARVEEDFESALLGSDYSGDLDSFGWIALGLDRAGPAACRQLLKSDWTVTGALAGFGAGYGDAILEEMERRGQATSRGPAHALSGLSFDVIPQLKTEWRDGTPQADLLKAVSGLDRTSGLRGPAAYGVLKALQNQDPPGAEVLAQAALSALDAGKRLGPGTGDWEPFLRPVLTSLAPALTDRPELQGRVHELLTEQMSTDRVEPLLFQVLAKA